MKNDKELGRVDKIINDPDFDFFSPIDIEKLKLHKLTKSELLQLIKELNRIATASTDIWEGG